MPQRFQRFQLDERIPWLALRGLGTPGALEGYGPDPMTPLQQQALGQRQQTFEQTIQQEREATTQAKLQTARDQLQMRLETAEAATRVLFGATPENWASKRRVAVHIAPELEERLPETFDPKAIESVVMESKAAPDWITNKIKMLDLYQDNRWREAVVGDLAAIPDDLDPDTKNMMWQSSVALAEEFGVPEEFLNRVAPLQPNPLKGIPERVYNERFHAIAKQAQQVAQQTTSRAGTDKPPTLGSFEDYVVRYARKLGLPPDQLTPEHIQQARKEYQQSDDRARVTIAGAGGVYGREFDPKVVAEAIRQGYATPLEGGYARGQWGAITTQIFKEDPKFPLASRQRDYRAVQQLVRTLNQNQQVKLRQAITKASDSLSILSSRVAEFDGGRWKMLNRAALEVAEQTGGERQRKAVLLKGQIQDAIGELAQVLQQGGVPTDEARRMAAENFNAAWQKSTLDAAIQQVRDNMQMALHAIETTGPLGVSPDSPYLPPLATGVETGGGRAPTKTPAPSSTGTSYKVGDIVNTRSRGRIRILAMDAQGNIIRFEPVR